MPASGAGRSAEWLAQMLAQQGGYQVQDGVWVRRPARRRDAPPPECMSIVAVLDAGTPLDDGGLAFLDGYETSEWVRAAEQAVGIPRAAPEFPAAMVETAATEERWRAMCRLFQAIALAGPHRVRSVLRQQVAPFFFSRYPQGKIVALRYGTEIDTAAALLRVLYAQAQAGHSQYFSGGRYTGIQTLREWHFGSLGKVLQPLLDLLNYLFYPFVGGACAPLYGVDLVFLFDPVERHTPPAFPRNWLGFPSASAVFGGETFKSFDVLTDFNSPTSWRVAHQRFQHDSAFTVDERLELLRWDVGRLNRFLFELTDAANFTDGHDPAATLDPVFGYEHQLTVDRLMRKTLLAMSLDEAPAGNLMTFEVADLYDTLSQRLCNRRADSRRYGAVEFFKALFHPLEGRALLAPRLGTLPAPFGDYFTGLAGHAYRRIEETVLASVWVPGKITSAGVLVRDEYLGPESPMPVPDFVAEVMRAYRNAHHGYFTDGDRARRPSRFVYPVDGNLPVELSLLPPLWWLAYLADPGLVGWKYLRVGAYD